MRTKLLRVNKLWCVRYRIVSGQVVRSTVGYKKSGFPIKVSVVSFLVPVCLDASIPTGLARSYASVCPTVKSAPMLLRAGVIQLRHLRHFATIVLACALLRPVVFYLRQMLRTA